MKLKIVACVCLLVGAFSCTMLQKIGGETETIEKLQKASTKILTDAGNVIDGDTVRIYSKDSSAVQTIYLQQNTLHIDSRVHIDPKTLTALRLARLIEQMNRREKRTIQRTIKRQKSHE